MRASPSEDFTLALYPWQKCWFCLGAEVRIDLFSFTFSLVKVWFYGHWLSIGGVSQSCLHSVYRISHKNVREGDRERKGKETSGMLRQGECVLHVGRRWILGSQRVDCHGLIVSLLKICSSPNCPLPPNLCMWSCLEIRSLQMGSWLPALAPQWPVPHSTCAK